MPRRSKVNRPLRPRPQGVAQDSVFLTARQIHCLRLVSTGASSTEIGRKLAISADVVNEHVAKACRRLNVRTRTQAVLVAHLLGLL